MRSQRSRSPVRSVISEYPDAAQLTLRVPVTPGAVPTPGICVGPQTSGPVFTRYVEYSLSSHAVTTQLTTSRLHFRIFAVASHTAVNSWGQRTPRAAVLAGWGVWGITHPASAIRQTTLSVLIVVANVTTLLFAISTRCRLGSLAGSKLGVRR